MTKYRLSKNSGVLQTTINDICSGKARIENCSAETLYKISKTLNVTMEYSLESVMDGGEQMDYCASFDTFKSNICHRVKDEGDIDFILTTLTSDGIRKLLNRKWYPEALYLLAIIDYLSRVTNLPQ